MMTTMNLIKGMVENQKGCKVCEYKRRKRLK